MRGFAQQHDARLRKAIEGGGKGRIVGVGQRFDRRAQHPGERGRCVRGRRHCRRRRAGVRYGRQVVLEPRGGQLGDRLQGTGLLEQVAGPGHDVQQLLAVQLGQGLAVELDDLVVVAADDEQGRRIDIVQARSGQIGPAAARHHRRHLVAQLGRRHQRRAGAGAGAKEAQRQLGNVRFGADPEDRLDQALGEQRDVEDVATVRRFLDR